jgi:hypothetical protein
MSSSVEQRLSASEALCPPVAAQAANLIAKLDDFQCEFWTVAQLVRLGGSAVPFLADALLKGRLRSLPQPRCSLVRALAALCANEVLLDYLQSRRIIDDPEIRFAEDSVINAAARSVKLDFSAEAYTTLWNLAQSRSLAGVLEALAMYRQVESIPCFIRALESDLARPTAVQSLETFGESAKPYLMAEALRPEPGWPDPENSSSLFRRRACLRLLERLVLDNREQGQLLELLSERDAEMVMSVGAIILRSKNRKGYPASIRRLKALRSQVGWPLRDDVLELTNQLEEATKIR